MVDCRTLSDEYPSWVHTHPGPLNCVPNLVVIFMVIIPMGNVTFGIRETFLDLVYTNGTPVFMGNHRRRILKNGVPKQVMRHETLI